MRTLPPAWVEHLNLPPAAAGAVWLGRARGNAPWRLYHHRHAELEANLVLRGTGTYLIGDQQIPLRGGSLIWLFPGDDHCLVDTTADYVQHIVVWRPRVVRRWAAGAAAPLRRQHAEGVGCRVLPMARCKALATALELCAGSVEGPLAEAGLAWLLQRLWQDWQDAGGDVVGQTLPPAVARAVAILRDPDNGRAATQASIARHVGLSSDHLGRLFQKHVGCSTTVFRNRVCLERYLALGEVRGDRLSAALQAGFGSYAQFYRVHRELLGVAPSGPTT